MFRRAILSVVAVTCTLSRTHAHGQSTPGLDQIKDLVCVLILSGIQKDDLDASMLQKLQHHNVNIDDLNNEENVSKCKDVNLKDIENKIGVFPPTKTTSKSNEMSTETPKESFLNTVNHRENHITQSTTTGTPTVINDVNQANKEVIEYIDGKPKLESVLKFWGNFATSKSTPLTLITNSVAIPISVAHIKNNEDQEEKRDISKHQITNVTDMLNKVLADLKKLTKTFDEETISTTKNAILNDDAQLLPSKDHDHKLDKPSNGYNVGNIFNKIRTKTNNPVYEQRYPNLDTQESTTVSTYFDFKQILASINKKNEYPIASLAHSNHNKFKSKEEEMALPKNIHLDTVFKHKVDSVINNSNKTDPIIPHNIIKDIADSVKAIILRDIRKEMQTISVTTTTTQITLLTTKNEVTSEKKTSESTLHQLVLTKFLDLFEHIKALKTNPITISQDHKNEMKSEDNTQNFQSTLTHILPYLNQNMDIRYLPPNKNHNNTQNFQSTLTNILPYPNQNMDIRYLPPNKYHTPTTYKHSDTLRPYNFLPQVHKFRSHPVKRNKPLKPTKVQKHIPITIQTNAMEIPPIGVILNKPDNPIHENIMVTTLRSNRYRSELYIASRFPPVNLNEMHKLRNIPIDTHIQQAHFDDTELVFKAPYCSTHDCTQILKPKSNIQKVYDDFKQASHKDMNIGRYVEYLETPNKKLHLNTSGYHEMLENISGDSMVPKLNIYKNCCHEGDVMSGRQSECCNQKILSRQQISLNPIKKVSYDDSHFKNFLKSQQKVTEILERILAVKNNLRSVENI